METLKEFISEIQSYKKSLGLTNLSDDMILDCSVRIFNSQNISQGKSQVGDGNFNKGINRVMPESVPEKPKIKEPNSPASQKQIDTLKKLRYNGDISQISKLEASKLIEEGIRLSKENKRKKEMDY